jgi:hypothetical protein
MTALYVFVLIVGLAAGALSGIIGTGSSIILLRVGFTIPTSRSGARKKARFNHKGHEGRNKEGIRRVFV